MNNVIKLDNSLETVKRRENIMAVQHKIEELVASGKAVSGIEGRKLTHHFTEIDNEHECCLYGREMFMPKGTLVVGKIHKRQGLNFLLQGKIYVATEFGKQWYTAPCIIKGEANVKRVVYAVEDSIFVNVHLTKYTGEENLDKVEEDIVTDDYKDVGLMDSIDKLLEGKENNHGV
jgi:hypothetical protein